ncbi:hypothetical protein KBY91_38070 [Streptomyces sp. RK23]|uniref:hypothetical protein n=1 Tax=Streptomyces TaxID=1883 RepID=UPI001B3997B5|nr:MULTISPECIES: hypothetical protein [unclassified Streptomyces]MBQ0969443.1 hypothetical protein [Streptomyces sp. RK74B]MBQ1009192.1 hypothetical protein [Streptomyces sp. RK23]
MLAHDVMVRRVVERTDLRSPGEQEQEGLLAGTGVQGDDVVLLREVQPLAVDDDRVAALDHGTEGPVTAEDLVVGVRRMVARCLPCSSREIGSVTATSPAATAMTAGEL